MSKKKKKSTQSSIEYIPVVNKQLRWIMCRKMAESLYYSRLSEDDLTTILGEVISNPELLFTIYNNL